MEVDEDEDDEGEDMLVEQLQLTLQSGEEVIVLFARHPCLLWHFGSVLEAMSTAHGVPCDVELVRRASSKPLSRFQKVERVAGGSYVGITVEGGRFVLSDGAVTHNSGALDRRELKLLASDCIARSLRMFEDEIRRQNPGISDSDLRAAAEKERAFLLPGKTKEESHKEMVKMLVRTLDVNGDGNVSKAELMMQWNVFSKQIFTMRQEGALDCSIM
jgi:hypothetical protein